MYFGKRIVLQINVLMCQKRIKSYELAAMLGLTLSNLSKLINQKNQSIRFDTLCKLCEIFDCTPGDLIKVTNDV